MAKRPTSVCILPKYVQQIKKLDLLSMTSKEREVALRKIIGDDAPDIALIYEKSLTLKNQKQAVDKFIKNIDGISDSKKAKIKAQISERLANKKAKIEDDELSHIVKETLDKKYDLDMSIDTVEKISKLKKEAKELEVLAKGTVDSSDEKLLWGEKLALANKELANFINKDTGVFSSIKQSGKNIKSAFKEDIFGGIGTTFSETAKQIFNPGIKGIKASLDASGLSRQGLKVLAADRKSWVNMVKRNWKSWSKVGSKEAMEKVKMSFEADLLTRDLYREAVEAKLAVNVSEDFFPDSAVSQIKGLGNFFQASDDAYTLSMQGVRMDLFEKYVKIFKEANNGIMPSKEVMKDFARVSNSVTGRGGLGKAEALSGQLNKALFSARYQTAQINTVRHAFDKSLSLEARRIAQKNLAKTFGLYFGLMQGFSLAGGEVGWNPKEGTFGKVKMPGSDKWIDLTGGMAQYLSLPFKVKDKVSKGKPAYGAQDAFGILVDFSAGKLAPAPGAIRDYLKQKDFSGKQPTTLSVLKSLFVPITATQVLDDVKKQEELDNILFSFILEFIGTGVAEPSAKNTGTSPIDLILGR